jgi:hypothetical protein
MKVKRVLLFMVALTWPPFALAQQSVLLQNALDRLTTFGSLTIDGVYNLSTGVTISHSNVKLTCQPGNTSLNTAGNNVTAITVVTGLTGVEIAGCHSSGLFSNRGYTGTHAVEVQGNSEVTFTNPSFDNFYGTPIYIPGPGATIRVRGGNISNIGNGTQSDGPNGILAYNYTLLDVQNLSLLNITSGDGIKTASCNNGGCNGYAGTNVGTTYISNLRGTNIHRYCVEIGGNLQKVVDIESPVCDNTNAPWGMLGGLVSGSGRNGSSQHCICAESRIFTTNNQSNSNSKFIFWRWAGYGVVRVRAGSVEYECAWSVVLRTQPLWEH